MDNDWNVEDYRMSHETEGHWELRKKFMLMHKDKFPEDKLVCLAQVFSNVEFMGCRYPTKTMKLVADLSQGVVEEYRNSRQFKLKRTFVTASDAAGAKVKGMKRPRDSQSSTSNSQPSTQGSIASTPPAVQNFQSNSKQSVTYGPSISAAVHSRRNISSSTSSSPMLNTPSSSSNTNRVGSSNYGGAKTYTIDRSTGKSKGPADISDFVIVQNRQNECQLGLLLRSSSASGFQTEAKVTGQSPVFKCDVFINGKLFASAAACSKKIAKEEAAKKAIDQLRTSCYTILVKNMFICDGEVEKSDLANSQPQANPTAQHHLLHKDNIGNKLLRLMGWSGGGLGANQQGIEEPVSVQEHVRRAGLGIATQESKPGADFKAKAWNILREFAQNASSGCNKDLVFSSDFSREERAEIHQMAYRLNLKSRSYRKHDRQLVVSHKYNIKDLVAELRSCGGSNDKYELLPPQMESRKDVIQID